jgi:8-oxo-dGTP pyrophosphatase MutT (NUDIX family)
MMERTVRNAAKALIIRDDRMLAIKISDGKEEWYIMPGGGQEVEELLPETACREVAEELGLEVEVKDLAFVIEGVHGENFHRVDLVFLCEYKCEIENVTLHSDTNQVGYDWLDIKTLNTAPLYPSKLRRQIMNLYEGKEYNVYLGNEEIGDPEVTD